MIRSTRISGAAILPAPFILIFWKICDKITKGEENEVLFFTFIFINENLVMYFAEELKTFLWAMTPVGELRVAIPMGLTVYKLNPLAVYFFSVLGNLFSVFLILTFLGAFSRWTSKNIYFFNRFFNWLFSQTRKNHYDRVNKYGLYLLPFFVAVPLPITGGWTASLIAFVFGMPFKKAFPLIGLGILAAGLIVSFLTRAGIVIEKNFGWQILIGILLISGITYWLYKKNKNITRDL